MQGLGDQAEPCNRIPEAFTTTYGYLKILCPSQAGQRVGWKGKGLVWPCCWGPEASIRDKGTHLALHQHGHVHEHIMKLPDAVLQLDDLTVSGLDLTESLLRDAGIHDDLEGRAEGPWC